MFPLPRALTASTLLGLLRALSPSAPPVWGETTSALTQQRGAATPPAAGRSGGPLHQSTAPCPGPRISSNVPSGFPSSQQSGLIPTLGVFPALLLCLGSCLLPRAALSSSSPFLQLLPPAPLHFSPAAPGPHHCAAAHLGLAQKAASSCSPNMFRRHCLLEETCFSVFRLIHCRAPGSTFTPPPRKHTVSKPWRCLQWVFL